MGRTTRMLAGVVLLAACGGQPTSPGNAAAARMQAVAPAQGSITPAELGQDLATLRRVTASFHDFDAAKAAGWNTKITPCMTSPAGGMGFHYGNTALIDGTVRVDAPQLLLYVPEQNGRLRLVAVEYIVPLSLWTSPQPPHLFGRDFAVNQTFQVWALHAWVWDNNPDGIFANWNPGVACTYTNDIMVMPQP